MMHTPAYIPVMVRAATFIGRRTAQGLSLTTMSILKSAGCSK